MAPQESSYAADIEIHSFVFQVLDELRHGVSVVAERFHFGPALLHPVVVGNLNPVLGNEFRAGGRDAPDPGPPLRLAELLPHLQRHFPPVQLADEFFEAVSHKFDDFRHVPLERFEADHRQDSKYVLMGISFGDLTNDVFRFSLFAAGVVDEFFQDTNGVLFVLGTEECFFDNVARPLEQALPRFPVSEELHCAVEHELGHLLRLLAIMSDVAGQGSFRTQTFHFSCQSPDDSPFSSLTYLSCLNQVTIPQLPVRVHWLMRHEEFTNYLFAILFEN